LHDGLGATATVGIDSSVAMLEQAAAVEGDGVRFEAGDIAGWTSDGDVDLVFANASMQWVPDHDGVLARWCAALTPGGELAVQVPANADHPSHMVARSVAAEMLAEPPVDPVAENVLDPARYAEIFDRLGFAEQHVRLQVYGHRLASTRDVVEWVKGTSLTRFKRVMTSAQYEEFLREYTVRLVAVLGDHAPYFYAFKRILMWGSRQ
jgi:trans-aconitate 2-methyltransferase